MSAIRTIGNERIIIIFFTVFALPLNINFEFCIKMQLLVPAVMHNHILSTYRSSTVYHRAVWL